MRKTLKTLFSFKLMEYISWNLVHCGDILLFNTALEIQVFVFFCVQGLKIR